MTSWQQNGRTVCVWPAQAPGAPALYLNAGSADEGAAVYEALRARCPDRDWSLVVVSGLDWDRDLVPWDGPPLARGSAPCTGGAGAYLAELTGQLLPRAEACLPAPPCWRGVAGYSLAGLFALYALYRVPCFTRMASVSGSLWFPGLGEYLAAHTPVTPPRCLYFSIGSREHRTRNPLLRPGRARTEAIAAQFAAAGIETVFELNPGNHFEQPDLRTARGLAWLLER